MLAQKKIETKKLILLMFIICVMLSGTGFFLYKNYALTASQRDITMDIPAKAGLWTDDEPGIKKPDSPTVNSKNILNKQTIIDLDILSDSKFRELREGYSATVNFEVGKKNPFAP